MPLIRILTWIRRKSKSNNLPIATGKYYWKYDKSNIALSKLGFEEHLCQEASLTTDLSILGQEISDLVTSATDQICFYRPPTLQNKNHGSILVWHEVGGGSLGMTRVYAK